MFVTSSKRLQRYIRITNQKIWSCKYGYQKKLHLSQMRECTDTNSQTTAMHHAFNSFSLDLRAMCYIIYASKISSHSITFYRIYLNKSIIRLNINFVSHTLTQSCPVKQLADARLVNKSTKEIQLTANLLQLRQPTRGKREQ